MRWLREGCLLGNMLCRMIDLVLPGLVGDAGKMRQRYDGVSKTFLPMPQRVTLVSLPLFAAGK